MTDWRIFTGTAKPHGGIDRLPDPPNWRKFEGEAGAQESVQARPELSERERERGQTFRVPSEAKHRQALLDGVNAALYLRRPLLITGKPGTGKTSLAYAVAHELQLGAVLAWPITARSALQEGLYRYDAIARLQNVQLADKLGAGGAKADTDIGQYIQLGALGTALLPQRRPRVLLIDEFDKSDINLPNDLLNLFEEGEFDIPELARIAQQVETVTVRTSDGATATISQGKVRCGAFPVVVLTSNGERDFPPAFLRRCLRLNMPEPDESALQAMVKAHLGSQILKQANPLIEDFVARRNKGELSSDQLLNAVYLIKQLDKPTQADRESIVNVLMKYLTGAEEG
jgi:MoxR-like ATPase